MGKLDVDVAGLHHAAGSYRQLQEAARMISPQVVDEVDRIIATHGVMGYPVAVGVVAGLARRQGRLETKAAEFGLYADRFEEHAATYESEDDNAAKRYSEGDRTEGERRSDRADVQSLSNEHPLAPPDSMDDDPPHGKDPRYWLDTSKLIHVPEGELAPYGAKQVGPNLWHPSSDSSYNVTPPPPPAQYPFDARDVVAVPADKLGPANSVQIAEHDGYTYWAPGPGGLTAEPAWPEPQAPIDIRDVLYVPEGELAPWGYIEYLPHWWAPEAD